MIILTLRKGVRHNQEYY